MRFANDANCFALSEAVDGAAAGGRVVFGVIIGTGTGGGLVVNGAIVVGANAIAGEWGHNPLPAPEDDERGVRIESVVRRQAALGPAQPKGVVRGRPNAQHGIAPHHVVPEPRHPVRLRGHIGAQRRQADVFDNTDGVLEVISRTLQARATPSPPKPSP